MLEMTAQCAIWLQQWRDSLPEGPLASLVELEVLPPAPPSPRLLLEKTPHVAGDSTHLRGPCELIELGGRMRCPIVSMLLRHSRCVAEEAWQAMLEAVQLRDTSTDHTRVA